jgi:hypothetical protein
MNQYKFLECIQPLLESKTWPRFNPVNWSLSIDTSDNYRSAPVSHLKVKVQIMFSAQCKIRGQKYKT